VKAFAQDCVVWIHQKIGNKCIFFSSDGHYKELQKRELPVAYSYKPQARKQILLCLLSVGLEKQAQDPLALVLAFLLTGCVTSGWLLSWSSVDMGT
jgi:hypothetical protein